jgi:hypothetical protein
MRFSLRALLAVILGLSVLCALLFSVPDRIALLILLIGALHLPTGMVVGIVYFDKEMRAFCIGAAAGLANTLLLSLLYSSSMVLEEVSALLQGVATTDEIDDQFFGKLMFVYVLSVCLTGGLMGVVAHEFACRRRSGSSVPPREEPESVDV